VSDDEQGSNWDNYVEYNKTLRAWLVSFGIGGPLIFVAHPDLLTTLKHSGVAPLVVGLFLFGCASQIAVALINKTVAYYLYCGEDDEDFRNSATYRWSERVSGRYWIDLALDIASVASLALAVLLLVFASL
jgi:hypothetical protein